MHRILIVDDEREIQNILTRFFKKKDFEVLTALSGSEALAILAKEKVDAVLLDIHMPGMSGLEVLREVRATRPELPIAMITGETDEEVAKKTLEEGAFDYITKPFNFDYLERTLSIKLAARLL